MSQNRVRAPSATALDRLAARLSAARFQSQVRSWGRQDQDRDQGLPPARRTRHSPVAPTFSIADLNLPEKFTSFREGQAETVADLRASEARFSLLNAPPGTGKSLVYMALAQLLEEGERAVVLVSTRALQHQLGLDFPHVADVRGRANYSCSDFGTCDVATKTEQKCSMVGAVGEVWCPYRVAVKVARESEVVVTNYAYWTSTAKYGGEEALGEFNLLVLDEAHLADKWLTKACSVEVDRRDVEDMLGKGWARSSRECETVLDWLEWVGVAGAEASNLAAVATDTKTKAALKRMSADFRRAESADPRTWVVEPQPHGVTLSPIWPSAFGERYLFRNVPRVVLCSATLPPRTARDLGIPQDCFDYLDLDSPFDPAHRPFYYVGGEVQTRVDYRMSEVAERFWINKIDRIVEGRLDRKGIVHARSYERARAIVRLSKYSSLMMTHDSKNTRQVLEAFRRATGACVLVSPSVDEGHDFIGDLARYQVIAKVPFLDTRPPLVKARAGLDKQYVYDEAAKSIVQMAGRVVRSEEDWGETLIIDSHFEWFRNKVRWPRSFVAAWRPDCKVGTLPTAPPVS